jgi:hypothetical protein
MHGVIPQLPHTSSWRGAYLSTDTTLQVIQMHHSCFISVFSEVHNVKWETVYIRSSVLMFNLRTDFDEIWYWGLYRVLLGKFNFGSYWFTIKPTLHETYIEYCTKWWFVT